jgi:DNA-binding winged helix-turn-helix (wHTH) protein/Flp pilus assembly protein TadD
MPQGYRFGPYRLEPEKLVLERDGRPIPLRPKLVQTLVALVEAAPDVAPKEEIMRRVWPGVHVVESSLTRNISELRSELERGFPGQTSIETVPKRGYRFALPIDPDADRAAGARGAPARPTLTVAVAIAAALAALAGWAFVGSSNEPAREAEETSMEVAESAFRSGFSLLESWNRDDVEAALYQFERSIRAAPELWYGYHGSMTAQLTGLLLSGSSGTAERRARLRETADAAILYGPEIAVTHAGRGTILLLTSWDWDGALQEIEEGIRWNPENGIPFHRRGLWKTLQGRFDEARLDYDRAIELQADHHEHALTRAYNEFCAQRYDEAIAGVEEILPKTLKQETAHRLLAAAYGAKGDWEAAERALEKAKMPQTDRLNIIVWRLASSGDLDGARQARERLRLECEEAGAGYCDTALADTALGDLDAAFESLEKALRQRHWKLLAYAVDPRLKALKADSRWDRILSLLYPPK